MKRVEYRRCGRGTDMNLTRNTMICYLLGINLLGFVLQGIDVLLRWKGKNNRMCIPVMIASVLGASPGILLCMLLFDRRAVKENMMCRVFAVCMPVIQGLLAAIFLNRNGRPVTLSFWDFFAARPWLAVYLAAINLATFFLFGMDKRRAVKQKRRIRIVTLLGCSFIGGAAGGLAGMYLFRHKTRKNYFTLGLPLMLVMQAVVIFFVMNL